MRDIITAVKGFKDILPSQVGKWQWVEAVARRIFEDFGFKELRIPMVEKTSLFIRSIGETTDIVEKEMYTFRDKNEEYLTLRPEATASILRAYIEHNVFASEQISKLYTIGPMFRRERPQKGRFRQFHQIDAEVLGLEDPRADAELMLMLNHFFTELGLNDLRLEINSLGCSSCRPSFRQAIIACLEEKEGLLCHDCQRRLRTNPLRVFDCKIEGCHEVIEGAPQVIDYLCSGCTDHFTQLKRYLESFALDYRVNGGMVRGLDYYQRTTFEVTTGKAGAQQAIVGGGRYDGLIGELGGPNVPGIGFAIGMERLISLMDVSDEAFQRSPLLFIAAQGKEATDLAFLICSRLRKKGVHAEINYTGKSLKGQMREADKFGATYTLILDEQGIARCEGELRHMKKATQQTISLDNIENNITKIIS